MSLSGARPWLWLALPAFTACAGLPHADPVPPDAAGGYAEWRWPEREAGRNWADYSGHPDKVPDSFRTAQIRLQHLELGCARDWMPGLIRLAQRQYHKALRAFAAEFYEDAFADLAILNRQLDDLERRLQGVNDGCLANARQCAPSHPPARAALRAQFAYNSAEVPPAARADLHALARKLSGRDGIRLSVSGHASAEGSAEHNEALARHRAEAVARLLIAGGIAQNAIEIDSFGERQPLDSNATADGRALNRRVEIRTEPGLIQADAKGHDVHGLLPASKACTAPARPY